MKRSCSEADLSPREDEEEEEYEEKEEEHQFQSWIDYSKSDSDAKKIIPQSSLTKAKNELQFTLEFVFIWNFASYDRDDRLQIMKFVKEWLGSDTEEDGKKYEEWVDDDI